MSILIKNGLILTIDKNFKIIKDGAVYIENDRIVDVGKTFELEKKYKPEKIINAQECIVMPGLINAHTHSVSSLVKGLGADLSLIDWLNKLKWPYYKEISEDEAYIGALISYIENIKNGCTCVIDHYYPPINQKRNADSILKAIEKSGIRGMLIRAYHDKGFAIPKDFIENKNEILKEYERLIKEWNGKANGRIMVGLGPDNVLFTTKETLKEVNELAKKYNVYIHTHLSESQQIAEMVKKEYGKTSIELLHELGVLSHRLQAAHSVVLSDYDIELMARTKINVINNIITNTYLADGIAPVPKMLKKGINIALGTDATGTYGSQDMFLAMKFAASLHKLFSKNPSIISAYDVIKMATINGAKALGLESEIGSIEIGKKS